MLKGRVKFYNATKGFGFVIEEGKSDDERGSFIHASVLEKMEEETGHPVVIKDGDLVEYEENETEKGMNVVSIKLI